MIDMLLFYSMFQKFVENCNQYYNLKSGDTLLIRLPKIRCISSEIRCISSYVYLNYPNKNDLPILKEVKEIIPLSDCKAILETLEQYSNKYNAVKINGQLFTKEYIKSFLEIHELIDIKKSVEIETRWLDQDFYNILQRCKKLYEKKFMIYKKKLLLNTVSICVDKTIYTNIRPCTPYLQQVVKFISHTCIR